MNKNVKIILLIVIIGLLIRFSFIWTGPIKIWDETIYSNLGNSLSQNPFDYSLRNQGWSDVIRANGDQVYDWPKIGFRAPLLPYTLALLYLIKLDHFINAVSLILGAISIFGVYLLAKRLYGQKTAIYSAILFSLIPLHVLHSARILTDVPFTFFIIFAMFSFWKGFEENDKKNKLLFGLFLGLALLSRYTTLWFFPIFVIYLTIRNKSIKWIKDKYLWLSAAIFFLTISPLLIYSLIEYGNVAGAFIHGFKASTYWGGVQSALFFFPKWVSIFSACGIIALVGIIILIKNKDYLKKETYFLLIWLAYFLGMAMYMPHKEERLILAITPPLAILAGYALNKINKRAVTILVVLIMFLHITIWGVILHNQNYNLSSECFLDGMNVLKEIPNGTIIADFTSVAFYYTKKETLSYPWPLSVESVRAKVRDRDIESAYFLMTDRELPIWIEEYKILKEDADNSFEVIFSCQEDTIYTTIYKVQ
ncbi:phospholipid carrier-dependent glycosyltransferase [Candidatus Pacearchaeota archaeon]|nr:phospholipid carrier-dependent glycosyltransferase [Candidatus Pacearchaeota archaeon]